MMEVTLERWQSSEARQEIYFFVAGSQTYVAGINPRMIDEDEFREFLKTRGFRVRDGENG